MIASTEEIRACFPALARRHNGLPVAYFDAPGGTQVPSAVVEAMSDYLLHHNANTHWAYPTSAETDAILLAAREAVADFLNASPHEIAFGNNMTTLTFHLARSLGRTWQRGDEVIVTELDHHANVAPWRALERDFGITIKTARMIPEAAQLDYDHFASLLGPRTKLVAVGGASNAVGTINDLARVRSMAESALLFVDAVHLAPHELIDVQDLGCDFLACSSYKFYGPHAGILFARGDLLESLPFPKLDPAPDDAPERAETGTQNHEGIAGIGATVEFLAALSGTEGSRRARLMQTFAALHERGLALTRKLWDGLAQVNGIRLYGPPPTARRTPTVSFTIDGTDCETIVKRFADAALFVSHGDFYAATVIERLGVPQIVRVGCGAYTTDEEVERLLATLMSS
ncbi:MAG: cysteine desulfurase-like protein [Acidobacteria bacterium]|nr:cysteine desulfurase-like protein [Acidobacteriota bacterium]